MIDLDELERQLREAAAPRAAAPQASGRDDPLAELARIVGQDEPARGGWQAPRAPAAPVPPPVASRPAAPASDRYPADDFEAELAALTRGEPFVPPQPQVQPPAAQVSAHMAAPPPPMNPPRAPEPVRADDFDADDWGLRPSAAPTHPAYHDDRFAPGSQRQPAMAQAETEPVYEVQGQLPPHEDIYEEVAPKPKRRGLMAVATVLGVAAVGVAAALAMRSTGTGMLASNNGKPPVIAADSGPMKARPENPGGVEVPNQDRAIYTRKPEDTKGAKVVGGEEQPVDVAAKVQQAKAAPTAAPDPTTTTGAALARNGAAGVELPKPPQPTAAFRASASRARSAPSPSVRTAPSSTPATPRRSPALLRWPPRLHQS